MNDQGENRYTCAMMTLHKLSAGDGYTYYTKEVASADELRRGDRKLGDYYTAEGNPPGQWVGNGIDALGVSGEVTEDQMKALYGMGLHPDYEQILKQGIADGLKPAQAKNAAKLGRAYYRYDQAPPELVRKVEISYDDFQRINHRPASADERRVIRAKVGAISFREAKGRTARDSEELGKYITAATKAPQQAVAGYDMVFSPPKSVSTLWSLADKGWRQIIERAHEKAIQDALGYLEREALATRAGVNGVAQIDVEGGLVATKFRHYDSRNGDPQLHDHVVVANKVKGVDGTWRTIDGSLLYKMNVASSEFYNQRVMGYLKADLGIEIIGREVTPGKRPVMEIAGVDPRLTRLQSSRSVDIKNTLSQLTEDYMARNGKEPDQRTGIALAQQATLETRPGKKSARALSELRNQWREDAINAVGTKTVDGLMAAVTKAVVEKAMPEGLNVEEAARAVVGTVSEQRGAWGRHHVEAETRRYISHEQQGSMVDEATVAAIVDTALGKHSLRITPPGVHGSFEPLTRGDGTSVYEHRGTVLFTSEKVLYAEDRLLSAARTRVIPAASAESFDRALAAHQGPLDAGQRRLAQAFATSEKLLLVGTGPAGAGKTTALRLAADTIRGAGGRVVGLAPSAKAAAVMADQIGAPAHTIDALLLSYGHGNNGQPLHPEMVLNRGDVLIVDEAGMAGTRNLANVVILAEQKGALVRFIGDTRQLSAVQSGGALRAIVNDVGSVALEEVHRFTSAGEAEASLLLREPTPAEADPFIFYKEHGRITAGSEEQVTGAVFTAWQQDTAAGKNSVMIAGDNTTVAELNARAQAYRFQTGEVGGEKNVQLRDGLQAHAGDLVVTRKNKRTLSLNRGKDWVKNNDLWIVEDVNDDGSLTVQHSGHQGKTTLDTEYVVDHVELGYASTVHRSQGITADTTHTIITETTSRELAYVALTRGRESNRAYVVTEDGQHMDDVLATVAGSYDANLSAHEMIRHEQDQANSALTLSAQYIDVDDKAEQIRAAAILREVMGEGAEKVIASDSFGAVAAGLRHGEEAGWDPARLLGVSVDQRALGDAEDVGAVLSWRMERRINQGQTLATATTGRELAPLSVERVDAMLAEATVEKNIAAARLAAFKAMDTSPIDWQRRSYGHLSDRDLDARITAQRNEAHTVQDNEDPRMARREFIKLRRLENERVTRAGQDEGRRAVEAIERGENTLRPQFTGQTFTAPGLVEDIRRARAMESYFQAELRLRAKLPGEPLPPAQPAPDGLPEWAAPSRAVQDAHVPRHWREELGQRRAFLEARMNERGALLATAPPEWSKPLGTVPSTEAGYRRWTKLAAETELYRQRHNVPETETSILPRALLEKEDARSLAQQIIALHKATALSTKPEATAEVLVEAAQVARTHVPLSQAQQVSDELRQRRDYEEKLSPEEQHAARTERLATQGETEPGAESTLEKIRRVNRERTEREENQKHNRAPDHSREQDDHWQY